MVHILKCAPMGEAYHSTMIDKNKIQKTRQLTVLLFLGAMVFLLVLYNYTHRSCCKISAARKESAAENHSLNASSVKKKSNFRKGLYLRMRNESKRGHYVESVFFQDGVEVCRMREQERNILEKKGDIPDGMFEFFNETTKVKGEINFLNDDRYGEYKEFFADGTLKKEAEYVFNKIIWFKEYYPSGNIRMEQHFQDAVWDLNYQENKIAGAGKICLPDGHILREWDLTKENKQKYLKTYDLKGRLKSTSYFNEAGELIEE